MLRTIRNNRLVTLAALAWLITALLAIDGLRVAIQTQNTRLTTIERARVQSRLDTCYLIRSLGYTAAGPRRATQVTTFLDATPLANCQRYAHSTK